MFFKWFFFESEKSDDFLFLSSCTGKNIQVWAVTDSLKAAHCMLLQIYFLQPKQKKSRPVIIEQDILCWFTFKIYIGIYT